MKKQAPPMSSPRAAYAIMIAGVLAVLGLVGWALNRSFSAPVHSTLSTSEPASSVVTSPTQTTSATPADDEAAKVAVPRIGPEELRQRMLRNEVTVIDVRNTEAFNSGHIPGSIHIAFASMEAQLAYVPRTKPIVTYCT